MPLCCSTVCACAAVQAWEPAHKALPSRRFVSGSKDQTVRIWDANTRRCQYTMSSHTMIITCVRWGGEGLIYSSSRDCCINVWSADEGKLVRTLKGHAHWVNTMALSTESVLRSGAFDHTGKAPADQQQAKEVCGLLLSNMLPQHVDCAAPCQQCKQQQKLMLGIGGSARAITACFLWLWCPRLCTTCMTTSSHEFCRSL
jgi:hypothetical protein